MMATRTVVFVCQHGAAKSVLAAALVERLAADRGVPLRALARGTEPEPQIALAVAAGLLVQGIDVGAWQPRPVTPATSPEPGGSSPSVPTYPSCTPPAHPSRSGATSPPSPTASRPPKQRLPADSPRCSKIYPSSAPPGPSLAPRGSLSCGHARSAPLCPGLLPATRPLLPPGRPPRRSRTHPLPRTGRLARIVAGTQRPPRPRRGLRRPPASTRRGQRPYRLASQLRGSSVRLLPAHRSRYATGPAAIWRTRWS
jgi:hypothetical protein